jgi:hypothetical protein
VLRGCSAVERRVQILALQRVTTMNRLRCVKSDLRRNAATEASAARAYVLESFTV